MESRDQDRFLGTSRGLSDFHRFKEVLRQIEQDEAGLREYISRLPAKPSKELLKGIAERTTYLQAQMEALKEMMEINGIDGAIFYCVEIESRVAELLEKARRVLKEPRKISK